MEEVQEEEREDTVILAVNVGEDPETVARFVEELDYDLPVVIDPDAQLTQKYVVGGVPTTYYVSPEGINLGAYQGMLPKERATMFIEAIRDNAQ